MSRMAKMLVLPTALGVTGTSESSLCSPATKVTLRKIKATNCDTSATHYLCVSIGADSTGNRIIDQIPIAPNDEYTDYGPYTLDSTKILCASADAASKITLTIDGDYYDYG